LDSHTTMFTISWAIFNPLHGYVSDFFLSNIKREAFRVYTNS
jgi:hypothetical protein